MSPKTDPKSALSFKEKLQELDKITAALESDDIDLQEAISYFERGTELAAELQDQLDKAELQIKTIRQKFQAQDATKTDAAPPLTDDDIPFE